MQDRVDVAVIGGGAAGIAAARRILRHPGMSVLVIEARSRIGGRAHTMTARPSAAGGCDVPLDLGCAWLHSGLANVWTGLAEQEGFTVDRRPAPWDREDRDLGLEPEEQLGFADAMEDFRLKAEEATARGDDGPLSDLVPLESRWRSLLDAVSTYVSGAELDRVSVRDSADYRPGEGDDWRVVEGYGRLVVHHGRDLPVVLDTPVTLIDHSGSDSVRIETTRGTIVAKVVIVTASTDVLASENIRFLPALPDKVEAAALLPLGSVEKLWLGTATPELFPAEAYCMGASDTARTAAYHLRPFERPVIECFLAGDLARDLTRAGRAAALDFARSELRGHLGREAADAVTPLSLTDWGREPHILGSYAYAVPGSAGARARLAQPVDGRLFFAGEAVHPSRFTTAHGAYETGVAAAEAALSSLVPVQLARSAVVIT
ncbi:MAG: flavin monoamine oxidase family protein [Janthinobacterium lividum]